MDRDRGDEQRLSADNEEGNHTPLSPRSHLFDNDILRAPVSQDLQASDILTDQDYRKLRSSTFTKAIVPGLISAGVIAYFAPSLATRFRPPGPKNVGAFRTSVFILSLSGVMSYLSYSTVSTTVQAARKEAHHRSLPRAQDGSVLLADRKSIEDKYSAGAESPSLDSEQAEGMDLKKELDSLGEERNRTRWLKGKGLAGEVEEEGEMRDTWFRAGVPRKDG